VKYVKMMYRFSAALKLVGFLQVIRPNRQNLQENVASLMLSCPLPEVPNIFNACVTEGVAF